jgi:hypothetical protein
LKQTPIHVNDPPKKPTTRDKTKPLGFQRVGPDKKQHGVIRFRYFVVPFGTYASFNMCYYM